MTTEQKPQSRPPADIVREALEHVRYDERDGFTPQLVRESFDSLVEQVEAAQKELWSERGIMLDLKEQYQAARSALEGVDVFYAEAIGLIGELREDAELVYVADKGLPPHIEKARDLTDHEETLAQARAVLYPASEPKP